MLSRKDQLKVLFSKYYTTNQTIGLLEIMHEKNIPKGTIIKNSDQIFEGIFVIHSGEMGVFVYPYHIKKLMTTYSTKEVIGEWNMHFLYSKKAQYEAITDMKIIYFNREEYEKVIFQVKQDKYQENYDYFQNLPTFRKLEKHLMKKLCQTTKEKVFTKNEHVTLNGCLAD